MLDNKERDMTPFDRKKRPYRQSAALLPLIWGASWLMTRKNRLRIERADLEGLKPPFLVYATHQGFSDYYIAPLALFPHRANYISDVEGFAAFGEELYRRVGCLGKRRYVEDMSLVRNVDRVVKDRGDSIVIFPEARHAIVGTTTPLPQSVGKLAKHLGVSVLTLTVHGSYLAGPFWDEAHPRRVPITARLEKLLDAEQLPGLTAAEITARVQARFPYDEHRWQQERGICINDEKRAEGLHRPLYQCPACAAKYRMKSAGSRLYCTACGAEWELTEYGALRGAEGAFSHVPDWYEWERANVERELTAGTYRTESAVRVEALPGSKGFVDCGVGRLVHSLEGFVLEFSGERLEFPARRMLSAQIEYDYRGKGPCVVLSKRDCSWYAYPLNPDCSVTEMMFAAEGLYRRPACDGPLVESRGRSAL